MSTPVFSRATSRQSGCVHLGVALDVLNVGVPEVSRQAQRIETVIERVPLVGVEAQAEHARALFPARDEVADVRVVKIEPAHDRETVWVFAHRFDR